MKKFKFIDLFSGIGGFHQAMSSFGGECVLASDIDANAIKVYKKNYGIDSNINIRDIKDSDVPDHDVLCAGFPCQAFSKAGKQEGFMDQTRGTLFFEVARILKAKHPRYILLENVRNLVSHDNGNTYKVICDTLIELGYRIPSTPLILSPHQFGVPQVRERVYIPGIYDPENVNKPLELKFKNLLEKKDNNIDTILDPTESDPIYSLSDHIIDVLTAWDEFYHGVDVDVIGFPVWSMYFKTKRVNSSYPERKKEFIRKNQELYSRNKDFIDGWLKKRNNLKDFTPTEQKFEWQCGTSIKSIWEGVIQIRPSGVRVKKPDIFQALVALVQTPIIGKYKRKLSVREAARLQSFPDSFIPDDNIQQSYKQFGNSVNVNVVKEIFKQLLKEKNQI
ncbi:MAG: DNA cytosine methyltransferase [Candidatus Onthovivens sp.]